MGVRNMMKNLLRVSVILLMLVVACGSKEQTKQSGATDFSLFSLDGEEYTLSELKGQVVIIDFWATWCPPCRNSIPTFARLYNKYHEQGFTILGIGLDDEQALVNYQREMNIPYPVFVGDKDLAKEYDVVGIPKTIFIDKKGEIRKTQTGFAPELEATFDALIDSLLRE
jgi:thiol-disulfide isomerase/thioredoxin